MTKSVLISLLSKGNTAAEILSILDAIVLGDSDQRDAAIPAEGTLNPIQF
jgi:hypothetical protein